MMIEEEEPPPSLPPSPAPIDPGGAVEHGRAAQLVPRVRRFAESASIEGD